MRLVADLHLHSHYSISTSPDLDLEHLWGWAGHKGITLVGTGDFTHPAWREEMRRKLVPAEDGLYALAGPEGPRPVRFVLSAEISSIYRRDGRVRKVHNVVLAPSLDVVERISAALGRIGNLASDGRPILALDSRDLLEIVLESSPDAFLIPAHIWTPWFSALGSRSGFDTLQECYRDLTPAIRAVETGLSSDPPMNWMCSALDGYTLVSNSDAHSPEKLGREANLLDIDLSYPGLLGALRRGVAGGFVGTVEFFPEEGKYHFDGHRKCGIRQDPVLTLETGTQCPVCGKELTVGVLHRVLELADRADGTRPAATADYTSLVPLKELLAEIAGKGPGTQGVRRAYEALLASCGPELDILLHLPLAEIERHGGDLVAEAVRRVRRGEVVTDPGYDGEYGRVTVFRPGETGERAQGFLMPGLGGPSVREPSTPARVRALPARPAVQPLALGPLALGPMAGGGAPDASAPPSPTRTLTSEQQAAATHGAGPALVVAGPGTGKTRTLAHRVAHLTRTLGVPPSSILAATFTNRAAAELRERLEGLLDSDVARQIRVSTLHAFGLGLIARTPERWGRTPRFTLVSDREREVVVADVAQGANPTAVAQTISRLKQGVAVDDPAVPAWRVAYDRVLRDRDVFDLDDLILLPAEDPWPDHGVVWLLVDEVQDLSPAQHTLIRALAPPPDGNLFAIGDPDQAIYGFRGADPALVGQLDRDYVGLAHYRLGTSYRCPGGALKAAATVLGPRAAQATVARPGNEGERVRVVSAPTDRSEAEYIAREIERIIGGVRFFSLDSDMSQGHVEGVSGLGDIAVLVRMARMQGVIRDALEDHGIPYRLVGDRSWLEMEPVRGAIASLAGALADRADLSVQDRIVAAAGHVADTEALGRLLEMAAPFGHDLPAFLRTLRLGTPEDDIRRGAECVTVSTLHASKGLEYACVFVAGCEDGLLPLNLPAYGVNGEPDEERRLLYVGMTRAGRVLVLSHALRRTLYGRTLRLPRSALLGDCDPALYDLSAVEGKPPRAEQPHQLELDLGGHPHVG